MTANEDVRPIWPNGVVAECDECHESDVLQTIEWAMFAEPTVQVCRSCYFGWGED